MCTVWVQEITYSAYRDQKYEESANLVKKWSVPMMVDRTFTRIFELYIPGIAQSMDEMQWLDDPKNVLAEKSGNWIA